MSSQTLYQDDLVEWNDIPGTRRPSGTTHSDSRRNSIQSFTSATAYGRRPPVQSGYARPKSPGITLTLNEEDMQHGHTINVPAGVTRVSIRTPPRRHSNSPSASGDFRRSSLNVNLGSASASASGNVSPVSVRFHSSASSRSPSSQEDQKNYPRQRSEQYSSSGTTGRRFSLVEGDIEGSPTGASDEGRRRPSAGSSRSDIPSYSRLRGQSYDTAMLSPERVQPPPSQRRRQTPSPGKTPQSSDYDLELPPVPESGPSTFQYKHGGEGYERQRTTELPFMPRSGEGPPARSTPRLAGRYAPWGEEVGGSKQREFVPPRSHSFDPTFRGRYGSARFSAQESAGPRRSSFTFTRHDVPGSGSQSPPARVAPSPRTSHHRLGSLDENAQQADFTPRPTPQRRRTDPLGFDYGNHPDGPTQGRKEQYRSFVSDLMSTDSPEIYDDPHGGYDAGYRRMGKQTQSPSSATTDERSLPRLRPRPNSSSSPAGSRRGSGELGAGSTSASNHDCDYSQVRRPSWSGSVRGGSGRTISYPERATFDLKSGTSLVTKVEKLRHSLRKERRNFEQIIKKVWTAAPQPSSESEGEGWKHRPRQFSDVSKAFAKIGASEATKFDSLMSDIDGGIDTLADAGDSIWKASNQFRMSLSKKILGIRADADLEDNLRQIRNTSAAVRGKTSGHISIDGRDIVDTAGTLSGLISSLDNWSYKLDNMRGSRMQLPGSGPGRSSGERRTRTGNAAAGSGSGSGLGLGSRRPSGSGNASASEAEKKKKSYLDIFGSKKRNGLTYDLVTTLAEGDYGDEMATVQEFEEGGRAFRQTLKEMSIEMKSLREWSKRLYDSLGVVDDERE